MTTRPSSRLLGGAATLVMTLSCTLAGPPGGSRGPIAWTGAGGGTHLVPRVAKGCAACRVTVAVTAIPGPLPDLSHPPASPTLVAYLTNVGEGGRNENRYDLKPGSQAEYQLELSDDNGSTRWTIYEKAPGSRTRSAHRTGHLAVCDPTDHSSSERDIYFKDCPRPILYDPREAALLNDRPLQLAFASYSKNPLGQQPMLLAFASRWADAIVTKPLQDGPAWISCTSGCCTLAQ
jgi:hypothetical protein